MKKETKTLDGEKVKVIRNLQVKVPQVGKVDKFIDLVDKEGLWGVVEYLSGANKGNRKPIPLARLK